MNKSNKKIKLNKKNTVNKKVSIEKLSVMMTKGFMQAKKDNEDLAVMVQQGFEESNRRFAKLEQGQAKLEQGHEEMKMRLTSVAYQIDVVDLQKRMQKVEDVVLRKKQ